MTDATDNLNYEELDPGIRETVRWLRKAGYETCDSGDGKTKKDEMSCAVDVPHVFMTVFPSLLTAAARSLHVMLQERGLTVAACGTSVYGESVEVHASFDPVVNCALLGILNLDDAILAQRLLS